MMNLIFNIILFFINNNQLYNYFIFNKNKHYLFSNNLPKIMLLFGK